MCLPFQFLHQLMDDVGSGKKKKKIDGCVEFPVIWRADGSTWSGPVYSFLVRAPPIRLNTKKREQTKMCAAVWTLTFSLLWLELVITCRTESPTTPNNVKPKSVEGSEGISAFINKSSCQWIPCWELRNNFSWSSFSSWLLIVYRLVRENQAYDIHIRSWWPDAPRMPSS